MKIKFLIVMLVLAAFRLQATFNGFDMTQDMPINCVPLTPDRLYTPAGNYTKLLKQRHAYCRQCKRTARRGVACQRHQEEKPKINYDATQRNFELFPFELEPKSASAKTVKSC